MLFRGMDRTRNSARWLALVAMTFVLLGPVCAAAEGYGTAAPVKQAAVLDEHGGSETVCCATLEDAALGGPVAQAAPEAKFPAIASARAAPRLALSIPTLLPRAGPPGAPPRTRQSYFARSARILS